MTRVTLDIESNGFGIDHGPIWTMDLAEAEQRALAFYIQNGKVTGEVSAYLNPDRRTSMSKFWWNYFMEFLSDLTNFVRDPGSWTLLPRRIFIATLPVSAVLFFALYMILSIIGNALAAGETIYFEMIREAPYLWNDNSYRARGWRKFRGRY